MRVLPVAIIMCSALCIVGSSTTSAQAPPKQSPSTSPTANAIHLDGLDIEFDSGGNWTRMYSTYRQPVTMNDRQGLRTAYTIAEEKGKAQIVRYYHQNVSSERLVTQVDQATQNATRTQGSQGETMSKTAQRQMVESVKEFTRSFSQGTLRGVNIIEQGYDQKADEVWVKIGITKGGIHTANAVRKAMNDTGTSPTMSAVKADSSKGKAGAQSSEVRARCCRLTRK